MMYLGSVSPVKIFLLVMPSGGSTLIFLLLIDLILIAWRLTNICFIHQAVENGGTGNQ
jgi:hypothetical protein